MSLENLGWTAAFCLAVGWLVWPARPWQRRQRRRGSGTVGGRVRLRERRSAERGRQRGQCGERRNAGASSGSRPKLRTVAYLAQLSRTTRWLGQLVRLLRVSYVDLCFASVDATGSVSYPDAMAWRVRDGRAQGGRQNLLALGGALDNSATSACSAAWSRGRMARRSCKDHGLRSEGTGLDCIDVDFEGPTAVNADYEPFVTLLSASLKRRAKRRRPLSPAGSAPQVTTTALQPSILPT